MRDTALKLVVRLNAVTEALAALLLVVVVGLNLAQIFFRYVLVDPISWSEEAMRYGTTWMVMLAAAPAALRQEHMAVSFFESATSPMVRRTVRLLLHLCVAGFCLLLIWKGFPAAIDNMRQVSPAIRVPMTLPYLAVPAGAVLILINTIGTMILSPDAVEAAFHPASEVPR